MVFVIIRLFDVEFWVVGGYLNKFPIQVFPEFWSNDRVSKLGRKDNVVVTEVYTVTISSILMWLVHTSRVSWRGGLDTGTHFIPRAYATGYWCGIKHIPSSIANVRPTSWIRTRDRRGIFHLDCSFEPKQCGRAWIRTRDRRGISSVL
jgi:hypothetical protein